MHLTRLPALLAVGVAAATLSVVPSADAATSGITFHLGPSVVVDGQALVVTGNVTPRRARKVDLELRYHHHWYVVAHSRSHATGAYRINAEAEFHAMSARYRVYAPRSTAAGKHLRALTSHTRALRTVHTQGTLAAPTAVERGEPFSVDATFDPKHIGRQVDLLRKTASGWHQIATSQQTAAGTASFDLTSPSTGGTRTYEARSTGGKLPQFTTTVSVRPAAPPAPGAWSQVSTGQEVNRGVTEEVSCPASNSCFASDAYGNVLQQTASGWSAPTQVVKAGGLGGLLSCPTTSFCAYVGSRRDKADGVTTFDGTSWTSPVSLGSDEDGITDLSCSSPTSCVAVGGSDAYTFDGTAWTSSRPFPRSYFTAISCPTTAFCGAVLGGRDDDIASFVTLSNGIWSKPSSMPSWVAALSCTSADFCAIAGTSLNIDQTTSHDYAAYWTGTTWTSSGALGAVEHTDYLDASLSCGADASCVGVDNEGRAFTLDGRTWSVPARVSPTGLTAISCTADGACTATDGRDGSVRSFDGSSWSDPTLIDPPTGQVVGVSCASATSCQAVNAGGAAAAYDGSAWSNPVIVNPADAGVSEIDTSGGLVSVSCAPDGTCAAGGDASVATFDGSSWSAPAKLGSMGADGNAVYVGCASATFCAAASDSGTLWTSSGSAWTRELKGGRPFTDVSCASKSFCLAVAFGTAYRWNGTTWHMLKIDLDPDGTDGWGPRVSCPTSSFCAVVVSDGVALTYDGHSWSPPVVIGEAHLSEGDSNDIYSVSCASADFCAATDWHGNVVTYDGSDWSAPQVIDSNSGETRGFSSISCPTEDFCVAVDGAGSSFVYGD